MKRACKDCGSETRKVSPPGPRCATCHREVKKARQRAAHSRWVEKTYGITGKQYWELYEAQGGVCWLCGRATGKTKRLAVDHDHASGFVRSLACGPCNSTLAHMRDDLEMAQRFVDYLKNPPAFDVIGKVKANG